MVCNIQNNFPIGPANFLFWYSLNMELILKLNPENITDEDAGALKTRNLDPTILFRGGNLKDNRIS